MASGAHLLQQQRGPLETRIKLLINNDLKEICKAYNYQVSGTKAVLQKRCIEVLDEIVNRGDQAAFNELNYRVAHHGSSPPRSNPASGSAANHGHPHANGTYHPYNQMAPGRAMGAAHRLPGTGKYFKSSPFYQVEDTVIPLTDLPEMPQNRNTAKSTLTLTAEQVARLKSDSSLRLLLYCGMSQNMTAYSPVDVAFPNQLEVKINGDDVRANFKGLKNKPGSTKPADITDKVRKTQGYQNQVHITYALTNKRYAFVVHLARHITPDVLTQRIKEGKHGGGIITKQKVLDEMNKANADDDIAATSIRMSLKDPISTIRISLPVRSIICRHNQCFDGAMFMQLQDQAPQWSCPVCSKNVNYDQLCVDKYFEEILAKAPSNIEKVDIEPNGHWQIIKEEDEEPPHGHSSKDARAPYDNDFDDDLVEVPATSVPPRPSARPPSIASATPALLSPASTHNHAMNTPPLSRGPSAAPSTTSTQNKRPASAVIDLTETDDEDEPPRPAKRQSTNTHHGNVAHYSTPTSLPDPRYSSFAPGQVRATDSFRPSSNAPRPVSNGGHGSIDAHAANRFSSSGPISLPGSPFAAGQKARPVFAATNSIEAVTSAQQQPASSSSGWDPVQHSRLAAGTSMANGTATAPAFQPFALRPPPPTSASPAQAQGSFRLPPIQSQLPEGYNGGWRSESGAHSHGSPGWSS